MLARPFYIYRAAPRMPQPWWYRQFRVAAQHHRRHSDGPPPLWPVWLLQRFLKRLRFLRWQIVRRVPRRLTLEHFMDRVDGGTAHKVPWNEVLKADPCTYCGVIVPRIHATIEHVKPVGNGQRRVVGSSGGPVENKVGACKWCNHRRGDMPLLFYLWLRDRPRRKSDGGATAEWRRSKRKLLVFSDNEQRAETLKVSMGEMIRWRSGKTAVQK